MSKGIRKMIDKVENFKELNNEDILKHKLLSYGGKSVKLGLDTEEEQNRMLDEGKIYNGQVNYITMVNNKCHRNVADKYKNGSPGIKIISGYALFDDIWLQHSWLFNKMNRIVETTNIKWDKYYGYELTKEESENFCFDNY